MSPGRSSSTPKRPWPATSSPSTPPCCADRLADSRALVRDRGSQFIDTFDEVFRTEGLKILKTPVHTPVANTFAERWIGTIRRELLDRTAHSTNSHQRLPRRVRPPIRAASGL